ncbi:MAG: hypothetical protein HS130_09100 [Deltaproteobacteria bacterium]|nr:hypothetical protein [Deltaproteobacteria bacterium]MCL4874626.1 hypothetical protein [bacterium]
MRKGMALVLCLFLLASCTSLSTLEKTKIAELESKGIRVPHEEIKNPGAAGALNLLPGFGNFYLAIGTNESEHWAYGFMNLLFWPLSIVWAVPEAAIDATTINKRNSVYHYTYGPGQEEIRRATAPVQPVPSAPESAPAVVPASTTPETAPEIVPVSSTTETAPAVVPAASTPEE